jgi:uncharacterized DUF497 family protein
MILAKYLRKMRLATFNARDARRSIGGELRDASHMDQACKTLCEAGLIRPVSAEPAARRQAKNYEVNPVVLEQGNG